MASINNTNVMVGDQLYDIAYGYGSVLAADDREILMRFPDGRRIHYTAQGFYGGTRRLYWHNPVVIEPPKENDRWRVLVDCLTTIHAYLLR